MTPNTTWTRHRQSQIQGFDTIPAGTQVELVMKIRPGNIGLEDLLQALRRTGDAEVLDAEFTVQGGEYDGRKSLTAMILDGTTAGHAKAAEISRALLRAIFEAVHGIDPNDNSPATIARRASAYACRIQRRDVPRQRRDRARRQAPGWRRLYRDKNMIGKVLRVGDQGYRKLEQPPPTPIERSAPPAQPPPRAAAVRHAAAPTAIAKPAGRSDNGRKTQNRRSDTRRASTTSGSGGQPPLPSSQCAR